MQFNQEDMIPALQSLAAEELDELEFGVIAFDSTGTVCQYNRHESRSAGLSQERVIGTPLFIDVGQCMNNFMVAQRFEDATADSTPLDATIDYVLTLRMRPTRVKLRLLSAPGMSLQYVLVKRPS